MIDASHSEFHDVLPQGRKAFFGVLNDPSKSVTALVHKGGDLSMYYVGKADGAVRKIVLRLPPEKAPRLADMLACMAEDKALIPIPAQDTGATFALPSSMMQNNSFGVTANEVVLSPSSADPQGKPVHKHSAQIVPTWLQEEVGCVITLADMKAGLLAYKAKNVKPGMGRAPPTSIPAAPDLPAGVIASNLPAHQPQGAWPGAASSLAATIVPLPRQQQQGGRPRALPMGVLASNLPQHRGLTPL